MAEYQFFEHINNTCSVTGKPLNGVWAKNLDEAVAGAGVCKEVAFPGKKVSPVSDDDNDDSFDAPKVLKGSIKSIEALSLDKDQWQALYDAELAKGDNARSTLLKAILEKLES